MKRAHMLLTIANAVLFIVGMLWALIVFVGTSWNGVRQHEIETSYLTAVPLPLACTIITGFLMWTKRHNTIAVLLLQLVLLPSCLIIVVAVLACVGVLQ